MNSPMHINDFGYAEMYEWANRPNFCRYGRFVQLHDTYPYLIQLAKNEKDLIGITTINAVQTSNMSNDNWAGKYIFDEYGDFYVQEKTIAVGHKEYDDINEMSYMSTKKQTVYDQIVNKDFDESKEYTPRNNRIEWVRVHLLGKCVVEDAGTCTNSKYCKLYSGDDEKLFGTVVPADENETCLKWRILHRVSDKTIMIFYK